MNLFGFKIQRNEETHASFAPKEDEDGAVRVTEGGIFGTYLELDGAIKSEAELVNRYRDMAMYPEVDSAIDDIVNEVIVQEPEVPTVELMLDELKVSDSIKTTITNEFKEIQNLLDFNQLSYEIFRRWYVDGRLYYHVIIDNDNPKRGILELRYIDPRKIRKIKPVKKQRVGTGVESTTISINTEDFFIYNEAGFTKSNSPSLTNTQSATTGLKLSKDSIIHCTSGLATTSGDLVVGYLHKAIKPLNILKAMEDAIVIYRIARAPERRIFYIDTGNLPRQKAEQHMRDQMAKFKNTLTFNPTTGEVKSGKRYLNMLEDFWLNRRGEGKGTEITTLPGGQTLADIDDILYFQKKLYKALNVPVSRLEPESQFVIGRSSEISRDEIKFAKFVTRLRVKFSNLFLRILERQLILKNIISPDEWETFKENIKFKFSTDNYFAELKEMEILRERISVLRDVDDYTGKYYSAEWIRKQILRQSEDDIKEIDDQIQDELENPQFNPPEPSVAEQPTDSEQSDDQSQ